MTEKSDTKLGKAFYAFRQIQNSLDKKRPDYTEALNHLKILRETSGELVKDEKKFKPILAANTEIVLKHMERKGQISNKVYTAMESLSKSLHANVNPNQMNVARKMPKAKFTSYDLSGERYSLSAKGIEDYKEQYKISSK